MLTATLPRSNQKVVLTWDRDPSIVNVAFKPLTQIRNKTVSHILGKRAEPPREGQGLGPAREKLAQVGGARCPMLKTDLDVTKTGVCRKLPKLGSRTSEKPRVEEAMASGPEKSANAIPYTTSKDCHSNGPHTLSASRPPGARTRLISLMAAPRSGKNCSPCWQNTTSKLRSANGRAAALPRCQSISGVFLGGIEHRLIDIDPGDLAGRIADPIDSSSNQARAAGNIENPVSILAAGLQYQIIRPRFLHSVGIAHIKSRSISVKSEFALWCGSWWKFPKSARLGILYYAGSLSTFCRVAHFGDATV